MSEPEYKLVPVKAARVQIQAGIDRQYHRDPVGVEDVYEAMVAVAPSPPKDPRDEALKVAREALGVALNTFRDTGNKYAAEECFEAIRQIKEIMGEK